MYRYEQLKQSILQEIARLEPYQRMHSRPALCKKYNVARATVDKALSELIAEGRLYSVRGSGTYVAPALPNAAGGVQSWGVILPNIANDICPQLVRGIEDCAEQHGINIMICNADNDVRKEKTYLQRMARSGVSGMIIIPVISGMSDLSAFHELKTRSIPLVFCHRGLDIMSETPLVTSNDFYGGYSATKHLLKCGYRRIAYVSRYRYRTSMNRYYGYMAALQEADMPINRENICTQIPDYDGAGFQRAFARMIEQQEPPDAFFCHNDEIAAKLYKALTSRGLRIGTDVGLIGYDNTNVCEKLPVQLTSVSFRSYEIGKKSAEVLYGLMQGVQPVGSNLFMYQPELIVRNSTCGHTPQPDTHIDANAR